MPAPFLKKAQNLSEEKRKIVFWLIFSVIFFIIILFGIGLMKHRFLSWGAGDEFDFKQLDIPLEIVDFKDQANELEEQWQDIKDVEEMLKNMEAGEDLEGADINMEGIQ